MFISLMLSHLTYTIISTECDVTGHNHGELGRALWSDPVCRGCDKPQRLLSSDKI